MLKEKLFCFKDLSLLSARDIKDWLCFNMAKELTEIEMIQLIFNRHRRRQMDINYCYLKEYANPCLSPDAGFVAACHQAGIDYDVMVGRIIAAAL
jgi:hypothetical protein